MTDDDEDVKVSLMPCVGSLLACLCESLANGHAVASIRSNERRQQ